MNRILTRLIETVFRVQAKTLTDAQESGAACVLCGGEFLWPKPEYRKPWTCLGLPWRHRHYACAHACRITVVEDVADAFTFMIPKGQPVDLYHLGADDLPLITGEDGGDILDPAYPEWIAGQRQMAVTIGFASPLVTRPMPEEYAWEIVKQAGRLGLGATIEELAAR